MTNGRVNIEVGNMFVNFCNKNAKYSKEFKNFADNKTCKIMF